MYDEIGVLSAVSSAFERLPADGVIRALEEIARHVPGIALKQRAIFPEVPEEIGVSLTFMPMMKVVSRELNTLFSGESGQRALVVLRALGKEHRVLGQRASLDGRIEYGIDCFGPYRYVSPKQMPFRRKKSPVAARASFAELCFYTDDPRGVYRTTYQLLNIAAQYILGNKKKDIP